MNNYEKFDSCYGTVQCTTHKGAYLQLDNGETAFAYSFNHLNLGDTVLCSIRKPATDDRYATVYIDSTAIRMAA